MVDGLSSQWLLGGARFQPTDIFLVSITNLSSSFLGVISRGLSSGSSLISLVKLVLERLLEERFGRLMKGARGRDGTYDGEYAH